MIRRGIAKRKESGLSWGPPPYGKKTVDGKLVDNKKEIEIIKIIADCGSDCVGAAEKLNQLGYKTRRNFAWTRKRVSTIRRKLEVRRLEE